MVYRNKILDKTHGKEKRELQIIEIIKNNPNIHFNAIKQKLVPKEMSLETLNKTLKDLTQREMIIKISMGDNKTHYILPNSILPGEENLKKKFNDKTVNMDKNILELKQIYSKLSLEQKSLLVVTYINSIFYLLNSIVLYNAFNNLELKDFKNLDSICKKQINEIFKIIVADEDKTTVILFLLDKILQLSEYKKIIKNFQKHN